MMRSRLPVWLFALSFSGLVVASSGCTRPGAATISSGASAAEPAPAGGDAASTPTTDDKQGAETPSFQFPDDAAGALLARVLPPADVKGPLHEPNSGPGRPSPAGLDAPSLPLPPTAPPCRPYQGNMAASRLHRGW